jgi:hypothetical protein
MKKIIAAIVLTAAAIQVPVYAGALDAVIGGVDFNVGGFGTYGVVKTDTNSAQFVRDGQPSGADESFSDKVDSNLAIQITARVNSWLSATVQVLDEQRQYSKYLTADVSWAYLKIDPITNLSFKVGRMEMPLFAISDSRDVNYANTWVRPPNEVYSLANIEELNGAEASYNLPLGASHLLLTGFAGNSTVTESTGATYNSWDVHGGEARWETEWLTVRAGIATCEPELTPGVHDTYTFSGLGVIVDRNNVVAQAEFVRRKSAGYAQYVNSSGWYVLGGYRLGQVLPYVTYASTTKATPYAPVGALSYDQSSQALGVRWDAFKSADLKFQLERVDPRGTSGISFTRTAPDFGDKTVTVMSLALDFVF